MNRRNSLPRMDGFHMPAEFEPHDGTIVIFPERPGSWPYHAEPAAKIFVDIIKKIAQDERVYVIVSEKTHALAKSMLFGEKENRFRMLEKMDYSISEKAVQSGNEYDNDSDKNNIHILEIPQNDAWARDTAPTFVINERGIVRGIDWQFNAWGGEVDGLYVDWRLDNALAGHFLEQTGYEGYDAQHFVLEGGSIHSDGQGTVLVTERCLLSKGRNPHMTKSEIAQTLCDYLGAEKIIWLPRGIYNDETNEHVDNICAFIKPGEVVLAWTDDKTDPQFPLSNACFETLQKQTDARGRRFTIHKLPIPAKPVCVTQHDMDGYEFEEGEDVREVGERLAASYVNFYFTNHSVLLPQFGGDNKESDRQAVALMKTYCRGRNIVPIPAREIIAGGGNIHCITQQIPRGRKA